MPATLDMPDLLTLDEVAAALRVSKSSVEAWVRDRVLPSFTLGRLRKVDRADVARFVALNTVKPRRPEWLTAAVEAEFRGLLRQMINEELAANHWQPGAHFAAPKAA